MGRVKIVQEYYRCPKCQSVWTVARKMGERKKDGHLKAIYCHKCDEEINHYKIPEYGFVAEWYNQILKVPSSHNGNAAVL